MVIRQYESTSFERLPAVDLLGDDAVRLERGAFDRVVLRERDPAALVRRFADAGAETIHVVDLDGARAGRIRARLFRSLAEAAAPAVIQASGGVRSPEDACELVEAGAARVVVGTAAFEGDGALRLFSATLGERLVVAIDVRGGRVLRRGWTEETALSVDAAVAKCVEGGVTRLLCTAVDRDGTLDGPDLDLLERVVELSGLPVLAAGGIRSVADVRAIEQVGCAGAIVGRALLEGRLPLSELAR